MQVRHSDWGEGGRGVEPPARPFGEDSHKQGHTKRGVRVLTHRGETSGGGRDPFPPSFLAAYMGVNQKGRRQTIKGGRK
jgi:hypothetical protein